MNLYAIPPMLTDVILAFIGVFVFISNKKAKVNIIFSLFCLSLVIWLFGFVGMYLTKDTTRALLWARGGFIGVAFIPVFMFHFIVTFLNINRKIILYVVYSLSVLSLFSIPTPDIYERIEVYFWGNYPVAGRLYFIFLLMFVILFTYGVWLLLKFLRKKDLSPLKRQQVKYVCLAFGFGTFGLVDYLGKYPAIVIYPFGYICALFLMGAIAYAIVKYQLLDIKVAISRATIFIVIYSLVLGIPFWLGYHLLGKGLWILPVALTVVFASAGPIVFRIIQKKAENLLFAKQKRYQKLLLQAARGMVREHNLNRLLKLTVHVIKRAVKVEFVGVFLEDKDSGDYMLKAVRNHNTFPKDLNLSSSCPLVECFKQERKILMYEEVDSLIHNHLGKEVHLAVPSFIENRLLGFLVLGEKDDRSVYTQDDIGVFEILSRQAALAIEHCLFLEEFKHAQDKIFQAEKLATIGGMASGIAHQMRNRLNLFSVAIGEMQFEFKDFIDKHPQLISDNEDLKKSLDYALTAARTISDNVKRTADVINGILNFARAEVTDTKFSSFSLKEAVELALMPLKTKHSIENVPLELNISPADMIYGVRSQLIEVILNLLDNAYEAVMEKFKYRLKEDEKKNFVPLIKMSLINDGDLSLIEVSDNGVGVKAEDRKKIFAPFFTTKSSVISGTGIGMFVVQRIVEENHKGRVWFESEYMQGAKFFVELPKKKWG